MLTYYTQTHSCTHGPHAPPPHTHTHTVTHTHPHTHPDQRTHTHPRTRTRMGVNWLATGLPPAAAGQNKPLPGLRSCGCNAGMVVFFMCLILSFSPQAPKPAVSKARAALLTTSTSAAVVSAQPTAPTHAAGVPAPPEEFWFAVHQQHLASVGLILQLQ